MTEMAGLTSKQSVLAALEGRPVGHNPVTVLYNQLYHLDHFEELTGEPQWRSRAWLHSTPDEYVRLFARMHAQASFEILQPDCAPPRAIREVAEFIEVDGHHYRRDKRTGSRLPLLSPVSGHAFDDRANETQYVFDKRDVDEGVKITNAKDLIARGDNDYIEAVVNKFGKDHFILSGGVVGVQYACSAYVGLTNVFILMAERPNFIDYLCHIILEQNIEIIRQLAVSDGDAIYIDDATATRDMVSVRHYERFSLPYMQAMVEEIHRLGYKAILIYFGGIADRLDQIAAIGADGLQMETSMKGYVNDIEKTICHMGDHVTLFGNLDPVGVLQNGTDEELEIEMQRQAAAGRQGRGFIMCTGSPITPSTPLSRVQKYIALGRILK